MEYFVSGNGKYFISISGDSIYTVRSSDGRVSVSDIPSAYLVGGSRAAVSDDGKLTATAEYSHKGIDLRDERGEPIWNTKAIKKVQGLYFGKDGKTLIVWNEDEPAHTYYVNIEDPTDIKRIVAARVIPNCFGDNIVFLKHDTVVIGGKKIKSPSFAFLDGVGTPLGICVSPVGDDPAMYNNDGGLMWRADIVKNGGTDHILQLTYNDGYIYARSRDGSIYRIDQKTGATEKTVAVDAVCILDNGGSYLDIKEKIYKI